jgi:hypothetical protein
MIKKFILPSVLVALISLSGCAKATETDKSNDSAKECEKTVQIFNQKLLSSDKTEKIQGWQIVLDNPTCFLSDAVNIAKNEISALQNQK